MSHCTNLADGVQHTRTRFMMGGIDQCYVRVLVECLLNGTKVRLLEHRRLQVDVGQSVVLAYLDSSRAVGTIVDNECFLAFGQQ